MDIGHSEEIVPNLISKKTIKKLSKGFTKKTVKEITWNENVRSFYSDYIRPNLFALIIFTTLGLFLTIKYVIKRDKDEEENNSSNNSKLNSKKSKSRSNKKSIKKKNNGRSNNKNITNIEDDINVDNIQNLDINDYDNDDDNIDEVEEEDSIYFRANKRKSNVEYTEDSLNDDNIKDDEVSYYSVEKGYDRYLERGDNRYSKEMLMDSLNEQRTKLTFDELAKLTSGS
jgi:hypothetical protein